MINNDAVSYHIFCFPFRWDCLKSGEYIANTSFNERTALDCVETHLKKEEKWTDFDFVSNKKEYYNRFAYFYDFSRDAIFNINKKSELLRTYFRPDLKGGFYEIKINKSFSNQEYTYLLDIEEVRINMYSTGVGVLSFSLAYHDKNQANLDDILRINDYGRRLYPQFIDANNDADNVENLLQATQNAFLAEHIQISDNKKATIFKEDFRELKDILNGNNQEKTFDLIGNRFLDKILGVSFDNNEDYKPNTNRVVVCPSIDDRMYVLCSYFDTNKIKALCAYNEDENVETYLNSSDDTTKEWMMYMFVDNSMNTAQSKRLRANLLKKHTYSRWEETNTLYGITRFSTVMLSEDNWFPRHILKSHMNGMYYEMAQLCLMQRATILRISSDLNIFATAKGNRTSDEIKQIYKKYISFINNLYFREVTAQEQGIEMYDMMQDAMRLEREVKSLDEEISEIFTFLNLEENEKQSRRAERLSFLATIFLPATVIAGLFGMNMLDGTWFTTLLDRIQDNPAALFTPQNFRLSDHGFEVVLLLVMITTLISYYSFKSKQK